MVWLLSKRQLMWDIFFKLCSLNSTHCLRFWFIFILFFQNSWFEDKKRLFTSWVSFRSTRLWYATSKNHRTSFAKKNIVKEIQRRKKKKKQCSQRKKKHFFVWNSGCLHNKVFPWGSPEGQKKNKVTFPVKFKLVPLVLLLYERKKRLTYSKSM